MSVLNFTVGIKFYSFLILFVVIQPNLKANYNTYSNPNPDSLNVVPRDTLSKNDLIDLSNLGQFFFPIHGKVISHFGPRGHQFHPGTDIKLNHGDTVRAGFKGIVTRASKYYGYGNLVVLNHGNNIETYYAHLSKVIAQEGDTVPEGTVLGLGGRTGRATTDHLHFEFRLNRKPFNPEQLFDFNNLLVISNVISFNQKITPKRGYVTKTEQTQTEFHVIVKKDTLYSLAKRYGTTVQSLCSINGIQPTSPLKIGEKLKVN